MYVWIIEGHHRNKIRPPYVGYPAPNPPELTPHTSLLPLRPSDKGLRLPPHEILWGGGVALCHSALDLHRGTKVAGIF